MMKCSVRNKGSGGRPASLCPQTLCLGLLETHSFVEHLRIQTFIERTSLVAQLVKNPWVGKIPWRRERLPTPVFWPGEFYGLYSPWGRKESDTTSPSLSLSQANSYAQKRLLAGEGAQFIPSAPEKWGV